MRITSTIGSPVEDKQSQPAADAVDERFGMLDSLGLNRRRLYKGEREKLRGLIEGRVAAMTAEQLSIDLDTGLEHHPQYVSAIEGLRTLVLASGTRLDQLLANLANSLPVNAPTALKCLIVEAVARKLGREWSDDVSSFVDVTIAATRLQDLAQKLATEAAERSTALPGPFVTIFLPEGEQHSLMAHLTGAMFQSFGWQHEVLVYGEPVKSGFSECVKRSDAICIGWSNLRLKSDVEALICNIGLQKGDRNQPLILGGAAALSAIPFLIELGIDCVCDSAYSAVKIADSFKNLEKINFIGSPFAGRRNSKNEGIDWQSP